jgi:predicted dienelactone hydrolase
VDPAVIDADRIGMSGHSFGGSTTLAVAGGTVSFQR